MSNNATCFMQVQPPEPPLIQNGVLVLQAHHIGWIVTGVFALVSTCTSLWLVNKHLQWYTNKLEQRYIVRILFMVPIYSIVSFASYLFWNHSTPLLLLRDCYESIVLTAFFYLLLNYLSPSADEQGTIFNRVGLSKENDHRSIMRGEPVKKWLFPLGFINSKPADGLYFLQMMKWGVLQYCVIRPVTTLAAVILNYIGLYCEDSWSPGWGHVYITVVVSISVSIAMYCLLQLYMPISEYLAPHRPLLKLFSIKAVVFLTFWQATFLSVLSFAGVVKDTQYMTADDINIGIGAILETVEMTIFAFLHIKAFSYKPYCTPCTDPDVLPQRMSRLRALCHAFDFRETLRELWAGWLYIIRRWRGVETDSQARRLIVRKELFDIPALESRSKKGSPGKEKQLLSYTLVRGVSDQFARVDEKSDHRGVAVAVEVAKEFHVNDERQWIGTGDDYIYGLGFSRRERSAGLAEQIEVELDKRGVPANMPQSRSQARENMQEQSTDMDALMNDGMEELGRHRRRRSWWGGVYDRLSRSGDYDAQEVFNPAAQKRMQRKIEDRQRTFFSAGNSIERDYDYSAVEENLYDEPPPPSSIREHWKSESRLANAVPHLGADSVVASRTPDTQTSLTSVHDIGSHRPSATLSLEDDALFARLFPDHPTSLPLNTPNSTSEASGPSSQTHPSSGGHHVRLTTPALVMPTSEWRATVRMPVIVDGGRGAAGVHSASTKSPSGGERGLPRENQSKQKRSHNQPHPGQQSERPGHFDEDTGINHSNTNGGESLASRGRHRREHAHHDSLSTSPPSVERGRHQPPTERHASVPKPDVTTEPTQDSFTSHPVTQSIPSNVRAIQVDNVHKPEPRLKRREAKHTLRRFSSPSNAYVPASIPHQAIRSATASSSSMPLRNRPQSYIGGNALSSNNPFITSTANSARVVQPSVIYAHSAGSSNRSRARVHVRLPPRLDFPRHSVQDQAIREEREGSGHSLRRDRL